jgi:hypothetical protein
MDETTATALALLREAASLLGVPYTARVLALADQIETEARAKADYRAGRGLG